MGRAHPNELRTRVVAFVDEGHGHREAARHFRVSPKFVNDLIKLRCETGSLLPRAQGNGGGHGKLAGVTGWIDARVTTKGEITLDELVAELAETHGIDVHRGTVWRVWMPPVLQADFSTVGLGFNRSCVRPHDVACLTPRAGMLFGRQGPHRFREL